MRGSGTAKPRTNNPRGFRGLERNGVLARRRPIVLAFTLLANLAGGCDGAARDGGGNATEDARRGGDSSGGPGGPADVRDAVSDGAATNDSGVQDAPTAAFDVGWSRPDESDQPASGSSDGSEDGGSSEEPDLAMPASCNPVPEDPRGDVPSPGSCPGAPTDWSHPYHVPEYGGLEDIEQAIWRASQGSGVVCIAPGSWYVSDDITILSGVQVVGAGRASTFLITPTLTLELQTGASLGGVTLVDTRVRIIAASDVALRALDSIGSQESPRLLTVSAAENVTVSDVRLLSPARSSLPVVQLYESTAVFRDCILQGSLAFEGPSDITFERCILGSLASETHVILASGEVINSLILSESASYGAILFQNSVLVGQLRLVCGWSGSDGLCEDRVDARVFFRHSVVSHIYGSLVDSGLVELESVTDRVPRFYDPDAGDYRLCEGSFAVDGGDPAIFDLDGTRSDLGAYGGPGVGPLITPRVEE